MNEEGRIVHSTHKDIKECWLSGTGTKEQTRQALYVESTLTRKFKVVPNAD